LKLFVSGVKPQADRDIKTCPLDGTLTVPEGISKRTTPASGRHPSLPGPELENIAVLFGSKCGSDAKRYFFFALDLGFLALALGLVFFPELHPHVLHICQSFHIRRSITCQPTHKIYSATLY